jgi:Tol biopolymer transport system component
MGEVYRARDPRLGREVAVKVLPQDFTQDQERLRRFEQEARVVGSLSHPNLVAVFDTGRHDGAPYVVFELLQGDTLRARLGGRPLRPEKAAAEAAQIARGLAAAHEKGIVHRDLKPENIFRTREGQVKILDFGLAKLQPALDPGEVGTDTPTASVMTEAHAILGTAGYMSPEQVRRSAVDHRADIFALGCVLYEMLSGTRLFQAATETETMAAILNQDPPPLGPPGAAIPSTLERIVRHCLEKRPEHRFQSARDLAFALESVAGADAPPESRAPRPTHRVLQRERLAWLVLLGALGLAFLLVAFRRDPPGRRTLRLGISRPVGSALPYSFVPVISPDGRHVAFMAHEASGDVVIWVRPLDHLEARPLPGTAEVSRLFWAPDGRSLGYTAGSRLMRVDIEGGPPREIGPARGWPNGGSWGRDGTLLFAAGGRLFQVRESGGAVAEIAHLTDDSFVVWWPSFLPDGIHYLFALASRKAAEPGGVYLGSLGSTRRTRLLPDETNAAFTPAAGGQILFVRAGTLMAVPFDERRLEIGGEPRPIATSVDDTDRWGRFSVSLEGTLAYEPTRRSRLVWFDRQGFEVGTVAAPDNAYDPELSPDGKRLIVQAPDAKTRRDDLWLIDVASGARSRVTFAPEIDSHPVWSPDGTRVVYAAQRAGAWGFQQLALDGKSGVRVLLEPSGLRYPISWHPDGRTIAFVDGTTGDVDISLLPLTATGEAGDPVPIVHRPDAADHDLQFSPDGRHFAYSSWPAGGSEIYVEPFPPTGARWQVSTGGGFSPRWRGDGRELYYVAPDRTLMAVTIRYEPSFSALARPLFYSRRVATPKTRHGGSFGGGMRFNYAVTRDGQRFLIMTDAKDERAPDMVVVVNWDADLLQRSP